jgi:hypothetical protein
MPQATELINILAAARKCTEPEWVDSRRRDQLAIDAATDRVSTLTSAATVVAVPLYAFDGKRR